MSDVTREVDIEMGLRKDRVDPACEASASTGNMNGSNNGGMKNDGNGLPLVASNPPPATAIIGVNGATTLGTASGPTSNNEQPVSKRQRIDGLPVNTFRHDNDELTVADGHYKATPGSVAQMSVVVDSGSSVNSSNVTFHHNNNNSSSGNRNCGSPSEPCMIDEIDKGLHVYHNHVQPSNQHYVQTSVSNCPLVASKDASAQLIVANSSSISSNPSVSSSSSSTPSSSYPDLAHSNSYENLLDAEMLQFQNSLIEECLCDVSDRILRRPFESHYIIQATSTISGAEKITRRIAALNEWPRQKLVQFLSNLQLLFDIYLKQNAKGSICGRIIDVCEALMRNEQNLIDEIIDLCDYEDKFVQFMSGRVLSSFLIIAKDAMNHDSWLKKLIDNLFRFERIDGVAIRRINFSLEIVKKIVEWKDNKVHPLDDDDEEEVEEEGDGGMTRDGRLEGTNQGSNRPPLPPLETNYFAAHYNAEMVSGNSRQQLQQQAPQRHQRHITSSNRICDRVNFTDSESYDTTNLKGVTIKNLENKWEALVNNMSQLIVTQQQQAESCVLTFLQLWESIISVQTNLSIVETLPFYAKLDSFEWLLPHDANPTAGSGRVPCTIYKQMLTLFNEALCYGSTLALQDMLPEETCKLAHQVVRHVKDYHMLDRLPRIHPENAVNLIGNRGATIIYESHRLQEGRRAGRLVKAIAGGSRDAVQIGEGMETRLPHDGSDDDVDDRLDVEEEILDMDKTLLQKMVLLVLKSVAVTVKEIRSDSSDSSIDSTDYEAVQDMVLIERSIRDVMQKLENFMKNTLEFHPESHFSKMLIHLFDDQDDYLIEAMVCILDVTVGISYRSNAFPELVAMLNPVLTFLEFLKLIANSADLLLDLLVSPETCFLLYLLRFLKYIRLNWAMFEASCRMSDTGTNCLDEAMGVLKRLRLQISRLVSRSLYPYDIAPVLRLLESCESLYEGDDLS